METCREWVEQIGAGFAEFLFQILTSFAMKMSIMFYDTELTQYYKDITELNLVAIMQAWLNLT